MRLRVSLRVLLIAALGLAACASPLPPVPPPAPGQETLPEYRIGPGDQLTVKLYYTPELNEDLIVRPDGRISLQLVGEIVAAGLTPAHLSAEIARRYREHLKNPNAVVILRGFGSNRAYVGGEVRRPSLVPLDGRMTVLDAVLAAGGARDTAELSSVILLRAGPGGREAYRVDLSKGFRAIEDLPILRAYDVVYLPKSFIAKVGTFVDLYINRIIPRNAGFSVFYEISDDEVKLR